MKFQEARIGRSGEPFVPMINVVFLLLIFFLITAQITPPAPFETDPPTAKDGGPPTGETILYVSRDGAFGFAEARANAAVIEALAAAGGAPLRLRADSGMEASKLAAALRRLSEAGAREVELVVGTHPKSAVRR